MSTPRIHVDAPLSPGLELPATPAQAHHVGVVLRRGAGDRVRLFNATDGEWLGEILAIRKDRGSFILRERLRPPEPEPALTLLMAVIKRDALDWAVEKATELGVTRIQLVQTRRTVVGPPNPDRLLAIARGAAEQCERLGVPHIDPSAPLNTVLAGWGDGRLLVAAERRQAPPIGHLAAAARALLIGPEGGFTPQELDDLAARPFVSPCRLGPRILRAETAAVAGLAALQALAGDWAG